MVRGDNMAVCYKKLWKMLIDKDMIKKRKRKEAKHYGSLEFVYPELAKQHSWNLPVWYYISKANIKSELAENIFCQ